MDFVAGNQKGLSARAVGDSEYFEAMSEAVQDGLFYGLLLAVGVCGVLLLPLHWVV
jgi:hypothetical protein